MGLVFQGVQAGNQDNQDNQDKLVAVKVQFNDMKGLFNELLLVNKIAISSRPRMKSRVNVPFDTFVLPVRETRGLFGDNPVGVLVSKYLNACSMGDYVAEYVGTQLVQHSPINQSYVMHFAVECARALEELHAVGIVHRDVSPDNFCLNFDQQAPCKLEPGVFPDVYLIDLGLARLMSRKGKHKPEPQKGFSGSPRYASLAAHLRQEQGFRDDLEALAYVFYSFLYGKKLPWANLSRDISESEKEKMRIEGKSKIPKEIRQYVLACRSLRIDEVPADYVKFVQAVWQ
jgi:serine/threonine protein kinase